MIVLDTHAWIWWAAKDGQLSRTALRQMTAGGRVGLSAISLWELAKLVERGRLQLDRDPLDWIDEALDLPNLELLPLTPEVASRSTRLGPRFHRDPADQLIVATAIEQRAPLITRDRRIRASGLVEAVW